MARPFSLMTPAERAENRRRLARGLPADFEEKPVMQMTPEEYAAAKAIQAVDREVTARRRFEAAFIQTLKGDK